jgi:hypothetical protein
MKSDELREAIIQYVKSYGLQATVELFCGLASKSTIYRWSREHNIDSLKYSYSIIKCESEWEKVKAAPGSYNARPVHNRIITTFQPHFYSIENELWKDKKIRAKLIANRKKYLSKETFSDRELLRGFKISGIHIGYSHFSPLWIKEFINNFDIKSLYDPCGGWGHRLVGAAATNVRYIYNDKWHKTYKGAVRIQNFLNTEHILYNNDCTNFTPGENYDAIFTCPPYFNKEIYEDSYPTLNDYKEFIGSMLEHAIKDNVNLIGIVINHTYGNIINEQMPDNFIEIERHSLGSTSMVNHFNHKNSAKKEELIVFKRIK